MFLHPFLKIQINIDQCAYLADAFLYFVMHSFHNRDIGKLNVVELSLQGFTFSLLGG